MTEQAFPLQWPHGRKRTGQWSKEQGRFDVTFARARDNVISEVQLLVGRYKKPNTVISTNIALRRDGFPLASQRTPDDAGVAVYFTYNDKQMSFCCDRWVKIEHNMQAVAKTIEALRGIARWGTGDMLAAAFTGFMALPAPTSGHVDWWIVLAVPRDATLDEVNVAYRLLSRERHPDHGGSNNAMAQLNQAREQARLELK